MDVYVVTHPEAGVIGVFASEGAWEQFRQINHLLDEDYEMDWYPVQKGFDADV